MWWIVSYKSVNCARSRFGFWRRTIFRVKIWPLQLGIPFVLSAIDYRVLCFYPSVHFGNYTIHLLIIPHISVDNKYISTPIFLSTLLISNIYSLSPIYHIRIPKNCPTFSISHYSTSFHIFRRTIFPIAVDDKTFNKKKATFLQGSFCKVVLFT